LKCLHSESEEKKEGRKEGRKKSKIIWSLTGKIYITVFSGGIEGRYFSRERFRE